MQPKPFTLHLGDCIDVMRSIPSNSVDAIVTDPPYEISFMGRSWDNTGIANSVEMWAEALRVLKPGGHLLAFSGSRTYHRMTCAIEDAGFEVRDQMMWLYGSGFPKSLDVSKAIDKVNGEAGRLHKFTAWMRTTGLTAKQINLATGTCMGSHYLTDKTQPAIPTPALWCSLRPLCGDVPPWVDELVQRIAAEREVLGTEVRYNEASGIVSAGRDERALIERKITAPATEAAKAWQGWGTALKPAHEPICVARKPFPGTVAQNVLEHGTGAINVDGCRIGDEIRTYPGHGASSGRMRACNLVDRGDGKTPDGRDLANALAYVEAQKNKPPVTAVGRWPANVLHDGEAFGDVEWARFFYCAKASKKDRDEGLEHMEAVHRPNGNKWTDQDYRVARGERPPSAESGPRKNVHPTVKPCDLMRHLVRLVTPPGGTVLDPFMGSGSTGKACMREGVQFIGIDMTPEYLEIARARIEAACNGAAKPAPANRDLFEDAA